MLLDPFLQQCREQPEALALAENGRTLSYGELLARALAIAGELHGGGVGPGDRVAIHLERGIDGVIGIFGVLLAGACYVPLDLKNPAPRLRFIVEDADVAAVIGQGELPDWLGGNDWLDIAAASTEKFEKQNPSDDFSPYPNLGVLLPLPPGEGWGEGIKQDFRTDDTSATGHSSAENEEKSSFELPHPLLGGEGTTHSLQPETLASILYTSGSTGQPKGVALSHRAIAAFAQWAADLVNLNSADRIASLAPFFFDLSTFDLYAVLGRGASLHFVPSPLTLAPSRLNAWLRDQAITGWYTVPSLLAFLAYKGNLAENPLDWLRFLIFAGEVFPTPALRDLAAKLPSTRLFNFFGPTETNVCSYWEVDRARLQSDDAIPIGFAAAGDELRIDEDTGELWVRGPTLASGYWSRGALRGFLNSEGWYPTGDRVSRNERGEYLFHGRLSRMLKCSGYRVEPAEIEAAINALPGVTASAVVGIADAAGGQRPAAVWVADGEIGESDIRHHLKDRLPVYMQPARFLRVERLPLLANGKVDYLAVLELLEARA